MPRVGRRLSLLLLLSTVHGLSNTTIFPDLATSQSDGGHWLSLPPGDGVAVSGVNRLGIPGLPLPSLLSSLLGPQPIATPGAPLPVPTVAQASPTVPQGPQLTPQIGDAGVLGGLLSALNTLLSPIASLADAVPVPPLPLPVSQPDFSSLASLDLAPLSLVPQLVSEILPLIPQLSTDLPEAIPLLANLESILDAELAAGVPQVGILTSAIAAEVTALEGQIFSGTSLAVAAVPVLTVELPSLTMALPVASELSALSRLSEIPLSELPEVLSQIVDPLNVELVSSVVGAIVSTLDSMVLNSEVQSLADAVTVVGGSSEMLVTQEWCSQLTVVDGNVVMASAPCNEALNTAVPEPTINSAPHFTDVPFAGLTITNSHSPAVTFLPPQPSQPQVQQTSSPAAPIIPNPAPSPPQVQQTSTPAAPIIPTPAPITITATVTQLSTITTCSPTSL
ncbi:hypothetical protein QBC41DRAFT_111439 [Cercophora samala]|uniref:Uncharacterized protein n=1 Tax=Cercophora samala TaxID=330535 RepID=A0AA40DBQ1_9PEZI|nr:hypothetical protein QBC41DRAFT_111439 [Cercophora samala]